VPRPAKPARQTDTPDPAIGHRPERNTVAALASPAAARRWCV